MAENDVTPDNGVPGNWLSPKEVAAMLGISTQTLRRWVVKGDFPDGIHYTYSTIRWKRSTVEEFMGRTGMERRKPQVVGRKIQVA